MKKLLYFLVSFFIAFPVYAEKSTEQRAFEFVSKFQKAIIATIDGEKIKQSEVTFALDEEGQPLFVGDFKSKKASLCVAAADKNGSIFNGSRATLQGNLVEVEAKEVFNKFFNKYDSAIVGTIEDKDPYQSIMPFVVDSNGRPVVLISDLAVHTTNIIENSTASFHVGWAVLQGRLVKVPDEDVKAVRKKYIEKFKEAKQWVDWADFDFYHLELNDSIKFYKLDTKSFYFIGGFGDINYLDMDKYKKAVN